MPSYPARQVERSLKAVIKQRAALEDGRRPAAEIRKPYRMKTRDYERHMRLLAKHEQLLAEAMAKKMLGV